MFMKKVRLLICTAFALSIFLKTNAQITVTDAYFPSANDSLQTAVALPQFTRSLRLTPASTTAQQWNFNFLRSALNSTAKTTERYVSATTDTAILNQFPSVKLVRDIGGGQLAAYNKTATRFELLGYKNIDFGGLLRLPIVAKFLQPVLERRAPLAFNTTNRSQSSFVVAFAADILPDTILQLFPVRPDSLRVRFQTDRQDKTDAFGTLLIPGASYDVLRERRFEVTETKIEAKVNPLPWLDITSVILTGQQRPRDTTIRYYFWSNAAKEPIAILTTDDRDSITRAEYKYLKINTSIKNAADTEGSYSLSVFPNPVTQEAIFDIKTSDINAAFSLMIVDNSGKMVLKKDFKNEKEQRVSIDVSSLSNGLYWARLMDENGKVLVTKSFVKN
jgi:Secretion system C-terminal sorting domain